MSNRDIIERRKLLRTAFDLIRHNPTQKSLVSNLAHALGGGAPVTEPLLDTARQIIVERAGSLLNAGPDSKQ